MPRYTVTKVGQALPTTAETVLQLVAPSSRRVKLTRLVVSFEGVSPSDVPVLCELWRQTGAGTSAAGTVRKIDPGDPAALASALIDFTAEPSSNDERVAAWKQSPNSSLYDQVFPEKEQPVIPESGRLGLVCTAPAAQTVTVTATIEE